MLEVFCHKPNKGRALVSHILGLLFLSLLCYLLLIVYSSTSFSSFFLLKIYKLAQQFSLCWLNPGQKFKCLMWNKFVSVYSKVTTMKLIGSHSMCYFLKGTQEWEFFWLRFWILYFFIVSYAQILRFCKKFFELGHYWGDTIIPLSLRQSRIEFSFVWD